MAVVARESNFSAVAENETTHCAGWFQINPVHHQLVEDLLGQPLTDDQVIAALKVPEINVQVAYQLYLENGWLPWRLN